ncbi:MAG TPA: hypothetical protein VK466_09445 [Terriglobales bacterium]|nr:hypothetical protein [Terriglobales bacterium]
MVRDRHRLAVLRYPARDSLPQVQLQAVYDFAVRILGSAQHQFVALAHVNETGIALHHCRSKLDDPVQVLMERVFTGNLAADVMKKIDIKVGSGLRRYQQMRVHVSP